ncbi:restriction endonuclease subunit S [Prosthecobacter sp.]|uniref:restriction endonuclease subunit S n=1 Tax=Prosthecobacter sp. TaxID=1965333 RepID=UPI0037832D6D
MPNKLPKAWVMTTLGEVAQSMKNGIYRPASSYSDDGTACLRMYNIGQGRIVWKDIKRMDLTEEEIAEYGLLPGDLLINRVNSRELVGKAAEIPTGFERCVFESKNIRVRLWKEAVMPAFVNYRLLLAGSEYFNRNAQQVAGMASVNQPQVARFPLPLPPISEQQRIVSKLDAMMARIDKAEAAARRALDRIQRYRAAVLQAAVTGELTRDWRKSHPADETGAQLLARMLQDRRFQWEESEAKRLDAAGKRPKDDFWKKRYQEPKQPKKNHLFDVPNEWAWASLDQLCLVFVDSAHRTPRYSSSGTPAIGPRDVVGGVLDLHRARKVNKEEFAIQTARRTPQGGDIVYSRELSFGWGAVVKPGESLCLSQGMCLFRPHPDLDLWLFHTLLNGSWGRHQAERASTGTSHPHINLPDIKAFAFPLPPIREQSQLRDEIKRRFTAVENLAGKLSRQIDRAQDTRQSLLREAFAGSLVPQDPKDEPAAFLLERIRAARESEAKKPKPKRMPKAKITRRPLLDVLREHKKPISPEKLFGDAGFHPDEADAFYRELTSLRKQLLETKPKSAAARFWPQRVKVLLELKKH